MDLATQLLKSRLKNLSFDGHSIPFRRFYRDFQALASQHGIDDEAQVLTLLITCLKGPALRCFLQLSVADRHDPAIVIPHMTARFPSALLDINVELTSRLQRLHVIDGDLLRFVNSFEELYLQLDIDEDENHAAVSSLFLRFCSQLPEPLMEDIISRDINSVHEAIALVRRRSQLLKSMNVLRDRPQPPRRDRSSASRQDHRDRDRNTSSQRSRNPRDDSRPRTREVICNHCGRSGHIRPNCPYRPPYMPRAQPPVPQRLDEVPPPIPPPAPVAPPAPNHDPRQLQLRNRVVQYRHAAITTPDEQPTDVHATISDPVKRANLPVVLITILGQSFSALVDTGAALTVVASSKLPTSLKLSNKTPTLISVIGEALNVIGTTTLPLRLSLSECTSVNLDVPASVIGDPLPYPVILGIDFLSKHLALLDLQSRELVITIPQGIAFSFPFVDYYASKSHVSVIVPDSDPELFPQPPEVADDTIPVFPLIPDPHQPVLDIISFMTHLTPEFRQLLDDRLEVFVRKVGAPIKLPPEFHHVIHLKPGTQPVSVKPRRLSLYESEIAETEAIKLVDAGYARFSIDSPWNCNCVLVPKSDGSLRCCGDFRPVNAVTLMVTSFIPNVEDLLFGLHGANYLSGIDLTQAFLLFPLSKESIPITACTFGRFKIEFLFMPFGLHDSPFTCQRGLTFILQDFSSFVKIYFDDIIIFSATLEDHMNHVSQVLDRLLEYGFVLNPAKCKFCVTSMPYLGHIVSCDGIRPDPAKILSITDFPTPNCVRDVRSFLGLCGYYNKFIPRYANIVRPLWSLTKNSVAFVWSPEAEQSFHDIKLAFASHVVLQFPDYRRPFVIVTDASGIGIAGILLQSTSPDLDDIKSNLRPIYFFSRILNTTERKYSAVEQECLAVVESFAKFRPFLHGHLCHLIVDCSALTYMKSMAPGNKRLQRLLLTLQEFRFTVAHRSGTSNRDADALSRYPVSSLAVITDAQPLFLSDPTVLKQAQRSDPDLLKLIESFSSGHPSESTRFSLDDSGILMYCLNESSPKVVVIPKALRPTMLDFVHTSRYGGHLGYHACIDRLRRIAYWPNLASEVQSYVRSCDRCQRVKVYPTPSIPRLPMPVPGHPFALVSMDLVGPLPKSSSSNEYILTIIDHLTMWLEAYPLPDKSGNEISKVLTQQFFPAHGLPLEILTDQGREFIMGSVANVCKSLGIQRIRTSSYHPSTNGRIERRHAVLVSSLRAFLDEDHPESWDQYLPYVLLAIRCAPTDGLDGHSPFSILYGRDPILPENLYLGFHHNSSLGDPSADLLYYLSIAQEDVLNFLHVSQSQFEEHEPPPVTFSPNDLVLVRAPHRVSAFRSRKLMHRYLGPYRIVRPINPVTYSVKPVRGGHLSTVHLSRLRKYVQQPTPLSAPSSLPDLLSTPIDFDGTPDADADPDLPLPVSSDSALVPPLEPSPSFVDGETTLTDDVIQSLPTDTVPVLPPTLPPSASTAPPSSDTVVINEIIDRVVNEDGSLEYLTLWSDGSTLWFPEHELPDHQQLIRQYNNSHARFRRSRRSARKHT